MLLSGIPAMTAVKRAGPAPSRRRRHAPLAGALGLAAVGAVLFACYLRQSRTVAVGSDGASQALQAWDLLHGNLLLHGWWVTDVSFYTTELPQYALIEAARGLTADVIHVAGALTYTLLVLAAAFLAQGQPIDRGQPGGRPGLARALVAVGLMLAPQLAGGTQTLVLSPDHTGTGVPVLLVFLLIDRAPPRWYVPVLVWLGLAATARADAITLFIAVGPLAVVCALQVTAGVARHRDRLAAHWYPAALGAAAVLAVPTELAAAALLRALGGWQVNGLATGLAGTGQLAGNLKLTAEGLLALFGADFISASPGIQTILAVVHLAGVLLAAAGGLAAARRLPRLFTSRPRAELVPSVLLAGLVLNVAAYLAGVQAVNLLSTREIAAVLPFAAVLAGRFIGDWLTPPDAPDPARPAPGNAARASAARPRGPGRGGARAAGRRALTVVLAVYVCGLGYAAAQPPAAPQYADLAGWLKAHHLTSGLSGYHQANIVTLETGGAVTLRPLAPLSGKTGPSGPAAPLTAYFWNSSDGWFDPAQNTATFLVAAAPGEPGSVGPSAARAVATFGRPSWSFRYGAYTIMVWPRGTNLLAILEAHQSGTPAGPK